MTLEMVLALLVATVAAMGSSLALLVTLEGRAEESLAATCLGVAYQEVEDPDGEDSDWAWRLRMATVPEAYWY